MNIISEFGVSSWFLAKIMVSFFLLIYIVFAIITVRQINLMVETLEVKFGEVVKVVGMLHLVVAIFIFFLALVIL